MILLRGVAQIGNRGDARVTAISRSAAAKAFPIGLEFFDQQKNRELLMPYVTRYLSQ